MTRFLAFLLMLFVAVPAAAQTTHLVPRLVAEGPAPKDGGTVNLALVFEVEDGWHGYWSNPGDAGRPLEVEWQLPQGSEVGDLRFPAPTALRAFGLMNYVYESQHAILVPVTFPALEASSVTIRGEARWLACTDKVCVPERGTVALVLPVGEGPSRTAEFDAYRAALPKPLGGPGTYKVDGTTLSISVPVFEDTPVTAPELFLSNHDVIDYDAPQRFRRNGNQLIVDLAKRPSAGPSGPLEGVIRIADDQSLAFVAEPGPVVAGGDPIDAPGVRALLLAVGGAILGGLILNLMPCVFPILAMKALHLARAGEGEAEARRDALGYTAGAIVGTGGLGGLLLAIRAGGEAAGWAFQLQDPGTVFLLMLLAAAITLSLLGFYRLPVVGGEIDARGSFATGGLAALVATPCAGPFLGAALGTALLLPAIGAVAVFAALGLGLAIPFLVIAFVPSLRKRLPKPGPWMAQFQRILSIPMLATVAATLWLLWRLGGDGALAWGLGGLAALVMLLWLARRGAPWGWVSLGGVLAMSAAAAIMLPVAPVRADVPEFAAAWSEQAVADARADGRPVFVYFTADWCLTCKANEASSISRDKVQDAWKEADVAVFVADWTHDDPGITRALERYGRAAVPLYLWYAPGAEEPEVLPQILTPDMLVSRAQLAAR